MTIRPTEKSLSEVRKTLQQIKRALDELTPNARSAVARDSVTKLGTVRNPCEHHVILAMDKEVDV